MTERKDAYDVVICMANANDAQSVSKVLKAGIPGSRVKMIKRASGLKTCLSSTQIDFVLADLDLFVAARAEMPVVEPIVILVCDPDRQEAAREELARGAFDLLVWDRAADKDISGRLSGYFRVLASLRGRFRGAYSTLERRYENLVRALPDIIYELDTEGRFSFINDAVRLLGYNPDELLGMHFSALLHSADAQAVDRDAVLNLYEGVKTGGNLSPKLFNERRGLDRKTQNLEVRIKRKPGFGGGGEMIASIISYGEVSAVGEYGYRKGQKEFVGSVGIIRDVTLRRKSEETLRKLYQAVDQVSVCVCVVNRSFEMEYVNPVFFQTTQCPPSDVIGKNLFDFLQYTPERVREVRSLVLDGFDVRDELTIRKADGSGFWAAVLISPVRSPEGIITHAVTILEDISSRRAMEDLLKKAKEDAEAAASAKSDFLVNLSHELKSPVSTILSAAQFIRLAPEDAAQNASQIIKEARELMEALTEILDLVHSESQEERPTIKTFALGNFFRRVCEPYREQAAFRGLKFEVHEEGDNVIESDPDRLGRIVGILVDNAVKFTESGGVMVDYSIECQEGNVPHLSLTVSDTGAGLTAETQARLFEPFREYGIDAGNAVRGVGMALARNLVRTLGGEIRVESSPGRGSSFSVLIPVGAPSETRSNGVSETPSRSFLVVDDNEVNLEYMRVLLEEGGHEVYTALGGMEALQILETRLVDAVFVDIQMPGMNGIELASKIRKSSESRFPRDIPLIALTAFDPAELEDPGVRFDSVFSKPVDIHKLLIAVDETITNRDDASPVLFSEIHGADLKRRKAAFARAESEGFAALSTLSAALESETDEDAPNRADARAAARRLIEVFENLAAPGAAFAARQLEAFFSTENSAVLAIRLNRLNRAFKAGLERLRGLG